MGKVIAFLRDEEAVRHADLRSRIGATIRLARGALPQAELAARLGIGQPSISAWEAGRVRLTIEQIWAVETALGLAHGWVIAAAGLCDPDLEPLVVLLEASCLTREQGAEFRRSLVEQ